MHMKYKPFSPGGCSILMPSVTTDIGFTKYWHSHNYLHIKEHCSNWRTDHFHTALLSSASKLTHCALVASDSERVTVALHSMFFLNTHQVVSLQPCLVVTRLMPCKTTAISDLAHILCAKPLFCVHHHQNQMFYIQSCGFQCFLFDSLVAIVDDVFVTFQANCHQKLKVSFLNHSGMD